MKKIIQVSMILVMAVALASIASTGPAFATGAGQLTGSIKLPPSFSFPVDDEETPDLDELKEPNAINQGIIAMPVDSEEETEDVDESDMDGDGVPDIEDNCIENYNPDQIDTDDDEIGNVCDNCRFASNPNQLDSDDDGIGDLCVVDADQDGIPDREDNCPTVSNPDQANEDNDFYGDACDMEAAPGTSTPEVSDNERQFNASHNGGCSLMVEGSNSLRGFGMSIMFLFGGIVLALDRRRARKISG